MCRVGGGGGGGGGVQESKNIFFCFHICYSPYVSSFQNGLNHLPIPSGSNFIAIYVKVGMALFLHISHFSVSFPWETEVLH